MYVIADTRILIPVFTTFLTVANTLMRNSDLYPIKEARYSEMKQMAESYQRTKGKLIEALNVAGCGHWIEKPVEQDQFTIAL